MTSHVTRYGDVLLQHTLGDTCAATAASCYRDRLSDRSMDDTQHHTYAGIGPAGIPSAAVPGNHEILEAWPQNDLLCFEGSLGGE